MFIYATTATITLWAAFCTLIINIISSKTHENNNSLGSSISGEAILVHKPVHGLGRTTDHVSTSPQEIRVGPHSQGLYLLNIVGRPAEINQGIN